MKRILIVTFTIFAFIAISVPQAMAADTSPPELVDWGLTVNKADISKTDAIVTVRFILSDDSGIALPNLLLKSLSSTQMTSFATVKELSRSGKLVSYEASAVIKFGQSPKVWEWVLYPLRDVLGNSSTSFGPGGSWRTQISVVDATFTDDILQCEGLVNNWNKQVEKFQLLESKYSGAQEIAIARLKFGMPIEALQVVNCNNQDFRFKYVTNLDSSSNLITAWVELATIWANTANDVGERTQRENEAKQAVADKAAAELKAKQEVEAKSAAELKAKKEADAKAAAQKKTTITCVKGKLTKKVTGIKPKCPAGFKKK
jgi:hypothetical protein